MLQNGFEGCNSYKRPFPKTDRAEESMSRPYVCSLIESLLGDKEVFFDDEYPNSEGFKLLSKIISITMKEKPFYARRIRELRKNPCYWNIAKFLADAWPECSVNANNIVLTTDGETW